MVCGGAFFDSGGLGRGRPSLGQVVNGGEEDEGEEQRGRRKVLNRG